MKFKQVCNEILKINFSKSIEKFFTHLSETLYNILNAFGMLFNEKHTKIYLQFYYTTTYMKNLLIFLLQINEIKSHVSVFLTFCSFEAKILRQNNKTYDAFIPGNCSNRQQ